LYGFPSEGLVRRSDSHQTVDNATENSGVAAEKSRDEVKLEKSPESPVQASDYKQDRDNDIERFHLYFSLFMIVLFVDLSNGAV
jgi:hypothetical protein